MQRCRYDLTSNEQAVIGLMHIMIDKTGILLDKQDTTRLYALHAGEGEQQNMSVHIVWDIVLPGTQGDANSSAL